MWNVYADVLNHLVNFWNRLDHNTIFPEPTGQTVECLDVKLENKEGELVSEVYHCF